MVAGKEFLKRYVSLVEQMQKAQDAFFTCKKVKGYTDRTLLQKAKDLEAEVKRATKDYYNHRDQLELTFN
jgi:hypothetical protein